MSVKVLLLMLIGAYSQDSILKVSLSRRSKQGNSLTLDPNDQSRTTEKHTDISGALSLVSV